MGNRSMSDLFQEAYFRGRKARRLQNFLIAVVVTSAAGLLTWLLLGSMPFGNLVEVLLLPSIFTLLGMIVAVSPKPQFLLPFWVLLGVLLATLARVVGMIWPA